MAASNPPIQDLPPPGGFPETIRYQRYLPKRGPSGLTMFVAMFGIMGYGWYWVAKSNAERRELRREKAWARINLVPLLQAETDRDLVRRLEAAKRREAEIMQDVPDWQAMDLKAKVPGIGKYGAKDPNAAEPVYHTDRYVQPNLVFIPPEDKVPAQWWRGTKVFLRNPPYHERADWKDSE
ncbi:hypothetical protein HK102_012108 [Quaeritorhiza haematococci]|nr:hypothetical protein HK102_012108 [Quaeritorhiza haematococci]